MIKQLLKKVAIYFSNITLFRRKVIVLADAIFDRRLELIDNFSLFRFLVENQSVLIPIYVINSRHPMARELKKKYKHKIISFDDENRLVFYLKISLLLPFIRYWVDGYFLLTGPLKSLRPMLTDSSRIDSINSQHGVNFFKIGKWERLPKTIGPDVYNCVLVSTEGEKKFFNAQLGFSPENIIQAGLSRWDSAKAEKNNNTIFVYFTWREYMRKLSAEELKNTAYYRNILALCSDKEFLTTLKKNNLKLKLALHHVLYEKGIHTAFDTEMIIDDSLISNTKKEAILLITDYSSMAFDFWFHNKGVLFLDIDSTDHAKFTARDKEARVTMYNRLKERKLYHDSPEEVINLIKRNLEAGTLLSMCNNNALDPFLLQSGDSCNSQIYRWLINRG